MPHCIPCNIRRFVSRVLYASCAGAAADEVHLKDGGEIHGTVVGYEGDSFKLQTTYGYALVRKDEIAAIIPSDVTSATRTAAKPKAQSRPNLEPQAERQGRRQDNCRLSQQ